MKKGLIIALITLVTLFVGCASSGGSGGGDAAAKISLDAGSAMLETTGNLVLEDGGNIGWWELPEDKITWEEVVVEAKGTYMVQAYASCDPQFPGSVINFTIADQTVTLEMPSTEAWSDYKKLDAGTVELKAGTYTMVVQAASVDNRFVANLKQVNLVQQ
jgi:hypothetical protein